VYQVLATQVSRIEISLEYKLNRKTNMIII